MWETRSGIRPRPERGSRAIREERPLAEVNEAIADVEAGRVPARVVFEL